MVYSLYEPGLWGYFKGNFLYRVNERYTKAIVVLIVVVVGAVFMTLYQGSITTIWNSIVSKITGLLS
ncbi:MAG: hypothetical protein WA125_05115 [Desulfosporosinus sp.]